MTRSMISEVEVCLEGIQIAIPDIICETELDKYVFMANICGDDCKYNHTSFWLTDWVHE